MTPLGTIRAGLEFCFDKGGMDLVRPEHWAKTHGRTVEEIVTLIGDVRADRLTRASPNATDDGFEAAE